MITVNGTFETEIPPTVSLQGICILSILNMCAKRCWDWATKWVSITFLKSSLLMTELLTHHFVYYAMIHWISHDNPCWMIDWLIEYVYMYGKQLNIGKLIRHTRSCIIRILYANKIMWDWKLQNCLNANKLTPRLFIDTHSIYQNITTILGFKSCKPRWYNN